MTARRRKIHKTVGPKRSSYGPEPLLLIALALQWYVTNAYTIVAIAMNVNKPALKRPTLSPKFNNPIANEPRMTVKFNHERNVLSLAKKTFGSTLVGNAILLPGAVRI